MKLLAFADAHGSLSALKKIGNLARIKNPDLLVCAGDATIFERSMVGILRRLDKLGKKIIMVHGNHESKANMLKCSGLFENILFMHKKHFTEGNALFLGYGGGGFSAVDRGFERIAPKFAEIIKENKGKKIILVTHAPPYKTKLDRIGKDHCGNKSIRNFIEKNKIDFLICGHLHENFGREDKIGKTRIINPGPFGKIVEV